MQEFAYQVRTYGGAIGDAVPPLHVTTLWNPGGIDGLVAYYRFEKNLADSAPDATDHSGVVSGAAPRSWRMGGWARALSSMTRLRRTRY